METQTAKGHFIENIIKEDLAENKNNGRVGHPLSTGTQRLSAYRPCQIHLSEL